MAGIIITPGTFNPPATPVETHGEYAFPRAVVQTLRKPWQQQQWSTRVVVGQPAPGFPVTFVERDYMSFGRGYGLYTVQAELEYDAGITRFRTRGTRYTVDKLYDEMVTGEGPPESYTAEAVILYEPTPEMGTPEHPSGTFPGSTGINIGTIVLEQGFSPLEYDNIPVYLSYGLAVEGTGDGATYTTRVLDGHSSGPTTLTGELLLRVTGIRGGLPSGWTENIITIDQVYTFTMILFRDGEIYDRIDMSVLLTGQVTVRALDGGVAQTPQPEILTDFICEETLYGGDTPAASALSRQPTIPATVGYRRSSIARQGDILLS